ncbi:ubiquinone/menaquinone biosynthesis C-methylase UbiE [Antricoccus suffuscus]|uniref:Ubiquinone/menaquinone biosynthesis C-methylase UbiE n=1 Tax=Antricoccus suffuscus TaxID=1629062 RepID=A0A2T1A0S6_9ACTN|nr:class I SAM-dependent methyltransferase [Antricoccus suffuscus]PRZ42203.1 ubiquinone/menaquinone biosynthesis C-methylase UbiE [Antricoccus suffuscus]
MIPDWNGEQGHFWVQQQRHQDAVLETFIQPVLDGAAIEPGQNVLDIGCGCGATTRAAGHIAIQGGVLGVDISGPMLGLAQELAADEGLSNVDFMQADAQTYSFEPAAYDAMISRFGVMFFEDPHVAFTNIATALRPGARLAYVCWQPAKANPHISLPMRAIVQAFPDALPRNAPQPPFSMADPETVRDLLSGSGFTEIDLAPIVGDVRVGNDVDDVMHHFQSQPMAKNILNAQVPAEVDKVIAQIRGQLESHAGPDGVFLGSAAWLVTAQRA